MSLIKTLHVTCAYATGLGFFLRGLLAITNSHWLQHRLIKTLPHIVDTVLLGSAFAMLYMWSLNLLVTPWLIAKAIALLIYIGFGLIMLRFGSTPLRRGLGFVGGLVTYAYILTVAHGKTPWPLLVGGGL